MKQEISPELPILSLSGVGPKKAGILHELGVDTIGDLLRFWPRSWEDRRNRLKIAELRDGEAAGFEAVISKITGTPRYYKSGKTTPFSAIAADDTGEIEIIFFNARWIPKMIQAGKKYYFFGTPRLSRGRMQVIHPEFQADKADKLFASHPIVPIYPLKAGLAQKDMRSWHLDALRAAGSVDEVLPEYILEGEKLCGIEFALNNIHFPLDRERLSQAKQRLIFEELFLLQVGLSRLKRASSGKPCGISFNDDAPLSDFEALLPFKLTNAQQRAISEVHADMGSNMPMNRLVQGDVGSGKTAVAAAAVFKAVRSGYQAVMMAPTEILAKQHFADLGPLFSENGLCKTALFTSGMRAAKREEALAGLKDGGISFAIGTHALLQPDVVFCDLGLVVTDEQHRFGVGQRISLAKKGAGGQSGKGETPDVLVMTATPIPRTLAVILYGDLDISIIDELPPGRKKIITKSVVEEKRDAVYDFARSEIEKGRQVYIVAPIIEDGESDVLAGVRSVQSLFKELEGRFRPYSSALLHGAMKQDEKDSIMLDFVSGGTDVLVSTVVIEVGVNVPNASMMIVESAERFGLAQLHQLRGRVGRGAEQSYCVLISSAETEMARLRLQTIAGTDDGFLIAERDLAMRGPGEIFGTRQHGIPALKIADLAKHLHVAEEARKSALSLLDRDPDLSAPEHAALLKQINDLFKDVNEVGL